MTKILYIAPILGVGGVSRLLSEIIPLMNREDDLEVSLLVSNYRDPTFLHKLKAANVNVRSLNISNIYTLDNIFKIADIIKEYDLIHVHLFPSIYIVALANLFAKKPLVYTEHATNNRRRDKWYLKPFEKWVYSKYCKIISIGNGTEAN